MNRAAAASVALATSLTLAACGTTAGGGSGSGGSDGTEVLASFYPLQYVAERVGGEGVSVESLTPAGAEPHDLELAPADVARLSQADLVVYLSGFQSAVDEAVEQAAPEHVVDAGAHADLTAEPHEHVEGEEHAEGETADEHSEEEHAEETHPEDEHDDDAGSTDPHFWLDPARLAAVATDVGDELASVDPDNADTYTENADALAAELEALDAEFQEGLADCELRTIVVSHEAYGYLTDAYDLEQVGLSGLDPESEPTPAHLAEIGDLVREERVTTIFTESLVNPKVAETLANDLGISTAVLDPVENQADEAKDYQAVMRENLAALQEALRCA